MAGFTLTSWRETSLKTQGKVLGHTGRSWIQTDIYSFIFSWKGILNIAGCPCQSQTPELPKHFLRHAVLPPPRRGRQEYQKQRVWNQSCAREPRAGKAWDRSTQDIREGTGLQEKLLWVSNTPQTSGVLMRGCQSFKNSSKSLWEETCQFPLNRRGNKLLFCHELFG